MAREAKPEVAARAAEAAAMVECLAMEEAMAAAAAAPVVSEAAADPERRSRWAAAPRTDHTRPCRQS